MPRKLTGQTIEPTPTVGVRQVLNGFFIGKFLGNRREVKLKKGNGVVYEFNIEDTDMPLQIKDQASGKFTEARVNQGDKVSIFAPTVLDGALKQATVGSRIKIVYLGEATPKKGGSNYHNFDVEEL